MCFLFLVFLVTTRHNISDTDAGCCGDAKIDNVNAWSKPEILFDARRGLN